MRDPESGLSVPTFIDNGGPMITHPREWTAFADAIIQRGHLERMYGVGSRYGAVSSVYGPGVREWPKGAVEELAYAEQQVFETQRALRLVMGVPPELA